MKLKELEMTKEELIHDANTYLLELATRFDVVAETAKGMYIYDEKGEEYLDFFAGIAVNSAGNCNEKVVNAIIDQAKDMLHVSNYPYSIPMVKLAKLICENIDMHKVFFQNSGTEANEAMIKMARKYGIEKYGEEHYHIVTAKQSFHGRSYGALSATGQPDNACQNNVKPMLPGFSYADFNDLESFKAACTKDTTAIMVEPVQGEGGVYPATKEFLQGLREFCDENDILLLFDEVQTGWGRVGSLMGYMAYGVKPDALTMAKAMGGGMPIGAVCVNEKAATAYTAGCHGSTFGGNPVCCAAAIAEIQEIIDNNLADNAAKMGDYFMGLCASLDGVKEVRGKGLLMGVEFEQPIAMEVKHQCFERHMLITAVSGNIIRMVPPLIVSKEECDKAFAILQESVKASLQK